MITDKDYLMNLKEQEDYIQELARYKINNI